MLKSETVREVASALHDLTLDEDRATALAEHVTELNSVVRATAARLDSSDQPALFDRLLPYLRRPAWN
jgi:hypothetical protein